MNDLQSPELDPDPPVPDAIFDEEFHHDFSWHAHVSKVVYVDTDNLGDDLPFVRSFCKSPEMVYLWDCKTPPNPSSDYCRVRMLTGSMIGLAKHRLQQSSTGSADKGPAQSPIEAEDYEYIERLMYHIVGREPHEGQEPITEGEKEDANKIQEKLVAHGFWSLKEISEAKDDFEVWLEMVEKAAGALGESSIGLPHDVNYWWPS